MNWLFILGLAVGLGGAPVQAQQTAVDAHLGRGEQLMRRQLFDEAAVELEQAVGEHPADKRVRFQYAVCLISLGRNEEARTQFDRVRKEGGESRFITYYLGRLDLLSNDYASAIKRLGSIAENPPFPDTAFHLGVAYVSLGDLEKGTKWLERAARLQPGNYRVHYRLARAYSSGGRTEAASHEYDLYTKLLNDHKGTESAVRACAEALRTQPIQSAIETCHRVYDPNDPEKLTLLGQLYGDGGAFEQALDPLQRATQIDPNSYEAWQNLGLTYFRLKRYPEAEAPLEKATALRPEAYASLVMLGAELYLLGKDDAALPVLEHANRLNPADLETADVLNKLREAHKKD